MKILSLIFLLFGTVKAKAQNHFEGIWVNDNNVCFRFNYLVEDKANFQKVQIQNADFAKSHVIDFSIAGDKLSCFKMNHLSQKISLFEFKIKTKSDSELVLQPNSKNTKKFFKSKGKVYLYNQAFKIVDQDFKFESISIAKGHCHGFCDVYNLTIDSLGKYDIDVDVWNRGYNDKHEPIFVTNTKFSGSLTEQEHLLFKSKVNAINWETFKLPAPNCRGCGSVAIEIKYNNKVKKFSSTEGSIVLFNLLSATQSILEKHGD